MKVLILISLLLVANIESRYFPSKLEKTTENPFIKGMFLDVVLDKLMALTEPNEIMEADGSRFGMRWQNGRFSRFTRLQ